MKMNSSNRSTDAERIARLDAATKAFADGVQEQRDRDAAFQAQLKSSFSAWISYVPTPQYGTETL
jgi:hypothetical protein